MNVVFHSSVTGQQRQWINDTIARSKYPLDSLTCTVTFQVLPEPTAPGHQDMMCTVPLIDGSYRVEIREGLDSPTGPIALGLPNPASDIKLLFQESIMHELGHVITFTFITTDAQKTTVASWFGRQGSMGDGVPVGELADWFNIEMPWEDRIIEAVAETIKDASLDEQHRLYDNRTNWMLT